MDSIFPLDPPSNSLYQSIFFYIRSEIYYSIYASGVIYIYILIVHIFKMHSLIYIVGVVLTGKDNYPKWS